MECYWSLSGFRAIAAPQRILPDGCVDIIFNFGDPVRRIAKDKSSENSKPSYVVGTMTAPIAVQAAGKVDMLGVRLRPGYAGSILSAPTSEFTDLSVPLRDVWGMLSSDIESRLAEATSRRQRLSILNSELSGRFSRSARPDPVVKAALNSIVKSSGKLSIPEVAAAAGASPRHLGRQFKLHVGVSPKTIARIFRLQNAVRITRLSGEQDWATVAFDAGYYDQAHLIHEFRELTGETPSGFAKGN